MEKEKTQVTPHQPPVLRQIAGAVLGILFVVTGGYSGLEFVFALLFSPVLIAGVIRLVIGLYRVINRFTGQRIYDDLGHCIMVLPRPGIASALSIVGLGCIISILASVFQFTTFAGIAVTCVLMALEVYTFLKDLLIWKQTRRNG